MAVARQVVWSLSSRRVSSPLAPLRVVLVTTPSLERLKLPHTMLFRSKGSSSGSSHLDEFNQEMANLFGADSGTNSGTNSGTRSQAAQPRGELGGHLGSDPAVGALDWFDRVDAGPDGTGVMHATGSTGYSPAREVSQVEVAASAHAAPVSEPLVFDQLDDSVTDTPVGTIAYDVLVDKVLRVKRGSSDEELESIVGVFGTPGSVMWGIKETVTRSPGSIAPPSYVSYDVVGIPGEDMSHSVAQALRGLAKSHTRMLFSDCSEAEKEATRMRKEARERATDMVLHSALRRRFEE